MPGSSLVDERGPFATRKSRLDTGLGRSEPLPGPTGRATRSSKRPYAGVSPNRLFRASGSYGPGARVVYAGRLPSHVRNGIP